jgi:hypothetical protein
MTAVAFPKPVRAPKKPRKPLPRSRMVRRKPRRLSRKGADPAYVAWIHTQPCVGHHAFRGHRCSGGIQQSHLRHHTGLGLKEPDKKSIAMCGGLHAEWEAHAGHFAGMSNLERFAWMVLKIAEAHLAYQLDGGVLL